MNDCIAPNLLQYSPEYLAAASEFRAILPDRLLKVGSSIVPRSVGNIDPVKLYQADPSECVRSGDILSSINGAFPAAQIMMLGGVIYSCALNDVIANFGEDDALLLKMAMQLDEQYAKQGLSEYALVVAKC
jgi:hypothetical protein